MRCVATIRCTIPRCLPECLKALQEQRTYVETTIRQARCDLDYVTERHGSPYRLVATKNEASYRTRSDRRRQDLERVAALGR